MKLKLFSHRKPEPLQAEPWPDYLPLVSYQDFMRLLSYARENVDADAATVLAWNVSANTGAFCCHDDASLCMREKVQLHAAIMRLIASWPGVPWPEKREAAG